MIKAIFFDFDGVILESVDVKTEAFGELFSNHPDHVESIVSYHMKNTGVSRFDKFRYIYGNILKKELDEKTFQDLCDGFNALVFQKVLACPYVSGIKDFIEQYHEMYDMFIVSATPHEEIRLIADRLGLTGYFKNVCGSPKSKGQWVKEAMDAYGYTRDEAVFIGDSLSDYKAAQENGIRFIARIDEKKTDIFHSTPVHHKVPHFGNLAVLIARMR